MTIIHHDESSLCRAKPGWLLLTLSLASHETICSQQLIVPHLGLTIGITKHDKPIQIIRIITLIDITTKFDSYIFI